MTEAERKKKRPRGSKHIRRVAQKRGGVVPIPLDAGYLDQLKQSLRDKDRRKIVDAALQKFIQAEELKPYQAELIRLQQHLERTGRKLIILFDGRDASGKGGTIRRVTRYMNEKHYRVVALGVTVHGLEPR